MISLPCSGDDINYDSVATHIPWVLQQLYSDANLRAISLTELRDAFRPHQMQCKSWLLDKIQDFDKSSKVLVIGSWLGFTSYCLYKMGFLDITETDPDMRLERFARSVNAENPRFIHYSQDINRLSLDQYDLIINSSCEHISDDAWFDRIGSGSKVVLHSTNLKDIDHVNTVESVQEMTEKYPMTLSFAGELVLNTTYSRYMLVGTK